ncbi:MAG TPA: presqualene diphosphate synthase HpnD [Solirubrobacteraceae bacterium]
MSAVDLAYQRCEEVTRAQALNFFYGIRLLPPDKRRAMCAVYAFARRVDDVGDGDLPRDEKLRLLAQARAGLVWNGGPPPADPVLVALRDSHERFGLPLDALGDLIDGVEADVRETVYASFGELVGYCRQVAGSIGRLSLAIFGSSDPEAAAPLADDLGVAMQLTNILRDVLEDYERGRVYLPRDDFARFDCPPDPTTAPAPALRELIRYEAARDREWFDRGLRLLPLLDPRSAACVAAMTGIYRRILDRIDRSPGDVLRGRISLPPWEKAWVAAGSLASAAGRAASARVEVGTG